METLIPIIPAPMASAPITPAPPTLSLEDENAIRVMKSTNEKRVAKRKLAEINKAAPASVKKYLKYKCKKCSLPALAGNYGFCGVTHRVQGIDFL